MTLAQHFRTEIALLKNQILHIYSAKLALQLDLPPLNIRVDQMSIRQRSSLHYWLTREKDECVYIQLTDQQGQTYHAGYLQGDEQLNNFYVSKIESSLGRLKVSERLHLKNWIMEHQQFNGLVVPDVDVFIQVQYQPILLKHLWSGWIMTSGLLILLGSLISFMFGFIIAIIVVLLFIARYQHLNRFRQAAKKTAWFKSAIYQLSQYIQQCKQQKFKEYYQLADSTLSQYDDDNMIQNAKQHNMNQLLPCIEPFAAHQRSGMFHK